MSAFEKLFAMFDKAANNIQYPKIALECSGVDIRLIRCGNNSRYTGEINIKFNGEWVGRINRDGVVPGYSGRFITADDFIGSWQDAFKHVLAFAADPHQQAAIHGHKHGNCCFCARDLTNAVSVHLGYGPICAEKYGLPHSIETVTDSVDMNSLDALLVDE